VHYAIDGLLAAPGGLVADMSDTLNMVKALVAQGKARVSEHGYDELAADRILVTDVLDGIGSAVTVEDYPQFAKGPSVLVLQRDASGRAIHVLWGIPKGRLEPAVVVTAYRPDPARWSNDFTKRKSP
jgi:hypothetical protein